MVLNAKMPSSFSKLKSTQGFHENVDPIGEMSQHLRSTSFVQTSNNIKWIELWENFDKRGIMNDHLLDVLWKNVIDQKPGLLGLMKKFDFICEKSVNGNNLGVLNREYFVPSRACIDYNQDFGEKNVQKEKEKSNGAYENYDYHYDNGDDDDDYDDDFDVEDLKDKFKLKDLKKFNLNNNIPIVEFFYDFCGFLPGEFDLIRF
jgi:hypothetical protein